MATEQVGGVLKLGGGAQVAGALQNLGGGLAKPPAPQTNPTVFDTVGLHLFGVPKGVGTVVIEQWGSGMGGENSFAPTSGGAGGGSGAYAKYEFTGGLCPAGGVLTVTIGAPGVGGLSPTDPVYVVTSGGAAKVSSGGANVSAGGTNTVTAGTGLTVGTNTAGGAGAAAAGKVGGDGGDAPAGGGGGGAGGADTKNGAPGVAPGGGGGGAGAGGHSGGAGAPGKVSISW